MTVWTTAVLRRSALLAHDLTWIAMDHPQDFNCLALLPSSKARDVPRGIKDKSPRGVFSSRSVSEVKTKFGCISSRCNEMRSAERGQEIVERCFVGQVDDCEAQAPLVRVSVEEIVITHAGVK